MSAPASHTPGPWAWFGNGKTNQIYLATAHSGRMWVMGFKRWGMGGAQPVFRSTDNLLQDASGMLQFEVGDRSVIGMEAARADESVYRYCIRGIASADACLIAAAPELFDAVKACSLELDYCQQQLAAFGQTGRANDSVSRALASARTAIAKATGQPHATAAEPAGEAV